MTTITRTDLTGTPATSGHAGSFNTLRATFREWYQNRVTRESLSQLSDHQLDDIGLRRSDIARF